MILIDIDKLKELEPHHSEDGYRVFYEYEIDNAPTVEERPHGEWKRITNESANIQMFLCSVCGRKVEVGYSHISPNVYYPFCHCGADMKGGAE